jgi:hypothetical protein
MHYQHRKETPVPAKIWAVLQINKKDKKNNK